MPEFKMFQADAFAERVFTGNPAAVLVLDEWPDEKLMQAVAAENNLAETAFARRDGDRFELRWFTPVHEAAFCGHATLATAHVLATAYGVGWRDHILDAPSRNHQGPTRGGRIQAGPAELCA